MSQFTLVWDNSSVLVNTNAISQRVSYRQRLLAGAYITTGFSLTNDLAKTVNTVDSPSGLLNNVVYQFKVQTICTLNSPTENDNGVQEGINFACITPVTTNDHNSASAVLTVTNTDITKARFTLKKASDNTIVSGPTVVVRSGNTISLPIVTGLQSSTAYYWQIELYATVNAVDLISSHISQIGSVCSPYPFTTGASLTCDNITSVNVHAIEVV